MTSTRLNTAFLLAGGKGTRLRPLTYELPKPLIEVKGKPILMHNIEHLKSYGINKFYLSVGYLKEKIMDYFGDGSNYGIEIEYIEEDQPLGTAGPLNFVRDQITESFLMLNSDVLSKIDVNGLHSLHTSSNAVGTITLREVPDPSAFGVAKIEEKKILEFVEKPKKEEAPSNLINAGFYLLEPDIFDYVPKGPSMLEYDVFPILAKSGRLYAYTYDGPWFDIGTHENLELANKTWPC